MIVFKKIFKYLVRSALKIYFNTYGFCFTTGFFKMKKSGGETDV